MKLAQALQSLNAAVHAGGGQYLSAPAGAARHQGEAVQQPGQLGTLLAWAGHLPDHHAHEPWGYCCAV